jgi:hypothetical protein
MQPAAEPSFGEHVVVVGRSQITPGIPSNEMPNERQHSSRKRSRGGFQSTKPCFACVWW